MRGRRETSHRVPAPTAPVGSLLELIQLARYRHVNCGRVSGQYGRSECLAAAESHRDLLAGTWAKPGVRDYVLRCEAPWEGLWHQVGPVVGADVPSARKDTRS